MALFSPLPSTTLFTLSAQTNFSNKLPQHSPLFLKKQPHSLSLTCWSAAGNGGAGVVVVEEEEEERKEEAQVSNLGTNGGVDAVKGAEAALSTNPAAVFMDPRWVKGTWDLKQFYKSGSTDWDALIDAEARRRKWLEDNPEASSNEEPVVFDSSIVPWWAWIKRFHLPEAELLNGRAAMIGFFMAYFVDSLTGVGLVDQMGNFFCKTLLFISVAGVLLIRKNEDLENVKKLIEETTFYDKQWQATWQDDDSKDDKK